MTLLTNKVTETLQSLSRKRRSSTSTTSTGCSPSTQSSSTSTASTGVRLVNSDLQDQKCSSDIAASDSSSQAAQQQSSQAQHSSPPMSSLQVSRKKSGKITNLKPPDAQSGTRKVKGFKKAKTKNKIDFDPKKYHKISDMFIRPMVMNSHQ